MRYRLLIIALFAGVACSPVLAQDTGTASAREGFRRGGIERGVENRENRRGNWRGQEERVRSAPQQVERAQRREQRAQAQPQAQSMPQAQPQTRSARDVLRAERLENRWQRRQAPVVGSPVQSTVVMQQAPDSNRDWRAGNAGGGQRGGDRTTNPVRRDRDGDGIRNRVDRDRDGDGVRNRRDFDRNNDGRIDRRWDRNTNGVVDRRFDSNRDGVRDGRNWGNNQRWNRDWRQDRRYDWQRYRYSNRDLFRQPRYAAPYGYGYSYQRFGIGIYLDQIFFGSRYRISDPWQYRLPEASYPYEWVRYYDDVLLVDTRNGYVVDVIHNFFW